jgi:hypothetical protein
VAKLSGIRLVSAIGGDSRTARIVPPGTSFASRRRTSRSSRPTCGRPRTPGSESDN